MTLVSLFIALIVGWNVSNIQSEEELYHQLAYETFLPKKDVFLKAMKGFKLLKEEGSLDNPRLITIIDMELPSSKKRLWVIDLTSKKVVYHSLVAHGKNTGELKAESFSNVLGSKQSSLGFYVTLGTYMGKHGYSLKLRGMEEGINDMAEERAIVMHGANYVSRQFIEQCGRLGRSFGCPAVPVLKSKKIIGEIKGGTCLFIYHPSEKYLFGSRYLNGL